MLSRRSFLKIAGLGTLAVGAGYGTGLFFNEKKDFISMYGFLPADEKIISDVFSTFGNYLNPGEINSSSVIGETGIEKTVQNSLSGISHTSLFGGNKVTVCITKINGEHQSDILLKNNHLILAPETDYNEILNNLRSELKTRHADLFFTADISNHGFIGMEFFKKRKLIIENEKGIFDEISLSNKTVEIIVPGNCGNTVIVAGKETAFVKKSSCRNKLCEHLGHLSESNSTVVCAPNRITIRLA